MKKIILATLLFALPLIANSYYPKKIFSKKSMLTDFQNHFFAGSDNPDLQSFFDLDKVIVYNGTKVRPVRNRVNALLDLFDEYYMSKYDAVSSEFRSYDEAVKMVDAFRFALADGTLNNKDFAAASALGFNLRKWLSTRGDIVFTRSGGIDYSRTPKEGKSTIVRRRSPTKLDAHQVYERYSTAVFMVFATEGNYSRQGSGFFINDNGLAVSNYHIFNGININKVKIKLMGSDYVYRISGIQAKSKENDFIIFKINCTNTNYIPIASSKPKIGDKVYAIGSPKGLENTFSSGEVSQWRYKNVMQINALIDHGSSGGALINEYGEVVGITSGTFAEGSQANLNYAWSIDVIKPYIRY